MSRTPIATFALLASLATLAACNGAKPSGNSAVTLRDMEVVDGTANDSMIDLDNATGDGTALANIAAAAPIAHTLTNASAAPASNAPKPADPAPADQKAQKAKPDAAE